MLLKCTKCGEVKPEEEFYNNRTMKRGKTYWCKVCTNYQNNIIQKETKAKWAARSHQNRRRYNTPLYLWKAAYRRAKQYGLEFSISVEDIVIPERCPYFGFKFSFDSKDTTPSLDKKDPSKGYTKDNIQVISWKANRMKSDANIKELLEFAKGVLACHAKEG